MALPQLATASSLFDRLSARRFEIEQSILTRVYSVSDPAEGGDPEYLAGLRAAVSAAVEYGLASVVRGEIDGTRIPLALVAQARQAARSGISLDTVLRRYFAGYTLLADFVLREAEAGDRLGTDEIHRLSRAQAAVFDRLVVVVTEEYTREEEKGSRSPANARLERVRGLLAGELMDDAELGYELSAQHLGVVASGPGTVEALRDLAVALDRRLLLVRPDELTIWAWFGGRRPVTADRLAVLAAADWPLKGALAIGHPAAGASGWRLSHRQALAALPVALRGSERVVRYADVAVLAAVLQDDLLATSLQQIYLSPLEAERDGAVLLDTARAYFAAGHNVSSTAAALGVNRHTVAKRLQRIEERLGRVLISCGAEMEAALRLHRMAHRTPAKATSGWLGRPQLQILPPSS